jgi:hypothetical protein
VVVAGSLIAVYHVVGDTAEVLTLDAESGEQVPIGTMPVAFRPDGNIFAATFGPGFIGLQWSLDRRLITVVNNTDGTYPRAQFDVVTNHMTPISLRDEAYVSPDGKFFAILGYDPSAILIVDLAGNVVHHLALSDGLYFSRINWAMDGSALIAAGSLPRPTALSTSPDGNGQVFADTSTGPGFALIVPVNGDPVRTFGGSELRSIGVGQMSPDMSKIVAGSFCQTGALPSCLDGLVQVEVTSAEITQLTTDPDDFDPQWSPDGTRIAFERLSGPDRGLWVMNSDGSSPTRLTAPDRKRVQDHDIAWSPDGSAILFTRGDLTQSRLGDLYAVPSAGGEPQLLFSEAVGDW